MEYLCTPQNACSRRYAIVNFTISAFLSPFFPDSFGHSKSLSPECKWLPLWKRTMASENRYCFFKFWGKWFVLTIVVTLQLSLLPWFLQSKFLYWKKKNFMAFLVITWWLFLLILRGALRIIGSCLFVQGSA